jgi:hypothetical protein
MGGLIDGLAAGMATESIWVTEASRKTQDAGFYGPNRETRVFQATIFDMRSNESLKLQT